MALKKYSISVNDWVGMYQWVISPSHRANSYQLNNRYLELLHPKVLNFAAIMTDPSTGNDVD